VRIDYFDWDDENEAHAERHGATRDEIEEVIMRDEGVTTFKKHPVKENRFFAYGKTRGGRWITTLFDYDSQSRIARPFAAWEMKPGERTKYGR
jgi:uncharacterized DUF497 family protein